jgi:hypothetical protein
MNSIDRLRTPAFEPPRSGPRRLLSLFAALRRSPAPAAQKELLPVDQGPQRADLFAFRAQLLLAVVRRDSFALLDMVDADIKNSLGRNNGIDYFMQIWQPYRRTSPLWDKLGSVLTLGGTFGAGEAFTAPYVFSRWPHELDPYAHAAVICNTAPVRVLPHIDFPVLTTPGFSIVPLTACSDLGSRWLEVQVGADSMGYISRRHVRSPLDHRAVFEKRHGRWRMSAFLAAD